MTHHKDLTMDINQPKYIVILILIGQIPMAFLSFNSIGKSLGYDYLGMTVFIYFAKLALVLITSFIACWVVSKKLKNNVVIYLMVGALFTPLLFLFLSTSYDFSRNYLIQEMLSYSFLGACSGVVFYFKTKYFKGVRI